MADDAPHEGNGSPQDAAGPYTGPRAVDPQPHDDHADDPAYVTRTKFLTGVAMATGGVMGAAIMVPVIGFAVADPLKEEEWRWVDVGAAKDILKNPPPFTATSTVGFVTSVAVSGPNPEADRRVFIRFKPNEAAAAKKPAELQASDFELLAIWNRCAHLGCPVAYSSGGDNFVCPCHGGAYDSRGRVVAGPPPRPLDRLDVKISDGTKDIPVADAITSPSPKHRVLVGKAYSIDAQEHPHALKPPGYPVTGVLSNLYPF